MVDDADLDALAAMRASAIGERRRPAPVVALEEFIGRDLHDRILDELIGSADAFSSNRTIGRDASVVIDPSAARPIIAEIERRFDEILAALGALGAPINDVHGCDLEVPAATATGHANFHAPHIDNDPMSGVPAVLSRRISFVWHAFRTPARFEGGGLRLWDHAEIPSERGPWTPAGTYVDLPCVDDSLVAFSSYSLHEVLPVRMTVDEFAARRFAIITSAHAS